MGKRQKQSFLQGAAVLTLATVAVKLIGMFYKVPLGNILGATGMSYFQTAYSIFSPVYALSIAGFPAAISKLVSESGARGQWRNVRKIFVVSFGLLSVLGLGGFALLFFGAGYFTGLVGNPQARLAVAAIAPSILFCCLMSCWRGYYQGLHNMTPTAVSQVIEAAGRLALGIWFAKAMLEKGLGDYRAGGTVFGAVAQSGAQAELLAMPWAAAGAVLGVSAGTVLGTLYLLAHHWRHGKKGGRMPVQAGAARPAGEILRGLLGIALPICLAALIGHVTNLVDVVTVMHRVGAAMERQPQVVLHMYQNSLPAELGPEEVPSFLYGAYGYAVNIFNLVPSLTTALGVSALPVLAAGLAGQGRRRLEEKMRSIIKLTALVAAPAGLGIAVLAEPILSLLYPARPGEVAVAAPLLQILGIAAVFVGLTGPLNSMFQALGKPGTPVALMGVGAVMKTVVNYVLVARPMWNILAVPVGTLLCYAFIFVASLVLLRREMEGPLGVWKNLAKPLFCGIACAAAAYTSYGTLSRLWESRLNCLVSIGIGGSIYLIFVLFLRIIAKNEVSMIPKGKKVAKILEKLCFLE